VSDTETSLSQFAVLSGDIIESTVLSAQDVGKIRDAIRETVILFEHAWGDVVVGMPEFFSGDAWQLAMPDARLSLRLALLIRARLRANLNADTRLAIGIGRVEDVHADNISLSSGEAFILSGRTLSKMTIYSDLTLALPDRAGLLKDWLPATLHLCSDICRDWTRRQAEITALAIADKDATHEQLAARLSPPVKKQTVTAALNSAHGRALSETLNIFENTRWHDLIESR
jgi:hypothetical protein